MRPIGMKHLEQSIQIVLSITGPFVSAARQESALSQPGASVLARRQISGLLRIYVQGDIAKCRIPDDCIDEKRYPLFMARAVLQELIESLQSTTGSAKP